MSFVLRDKEFDGLLSEVIGEAYNESCWVYTDGVAEKNVEEVEAVVGDAS